MEQLIRKIRLVLFIKNYPDFTPCKILTYKASQVFRTTLTPLLLSDQGNSLQKSNSRLLILLWPKVIGDGFNQENSAVSNLESITFPWASSIGFVDEETKNSSSFLARTTDKAWQVSDNFNISPNNMTKSGNTGQYNLAVSVFGNINNPYPEGENTAFEGKIVVIGDSDFISDGFLRNSPDNLVFFQNLVDMLSLDGDLISIRSKTVSSRPIKEDLTDSSRAMIRYINVFGLTMVVVVFGMIRYYIRRKSRFVDDL